MWTKRAHIVLLWVLFLSFKPTNNYWFVDLDGPLSTSVSLPHTRTAWWKMELDDTCVKKQVFPQHKMCSSGDNFSPVCLRLSNRALTLQWKSLYSHTHAAAEVNIQYVYQTTNRSSGLLCNGHNVCMYVRLYLLWWSGYIGAIQSSEKQHILELVLIEYSSWPWYERDRMKAYEITQGIWSYINNSKKQMAKVKKQADKLLQLKLIHFTVDVITSSFLCYCSQIVAKLLPKLTVSCWSQWTLCHWRDKSVPV